MILKKAEKTAFFFSVNKKSVIINNTIRRRELFYESKWVQEEIA